MGIAWRWLFHPPSSQPGNRAKIYMEIKHSIFSIFWINKSNTRLSVFSRHDKSSSFSSFAGSTFQKVCAKSLWKSVFSDGIKGSDASLLKTCIRYNKTSFLAESKAVNSGLNTVCCFLEISGVYWVIHFVMLFYWSLEFKNKDLTMCIIWTFSCVNVMIRR